jgi:hypothetical protein
MKKKPKKKRKEKTSDPGISVAGDAKALRARIGLNLVSARVQGKQARSISVETEHCEGL